MTSRFDFSLRVVIAGNGCWARLCRESIKQLDRSRDCNRDIFDRLSGISTNKFDDKLNDRSVGMIGCKLLSGRVTKVLSAKERYTRRAHFDEDKALLFAPMTRSSFEFDSLLLELPDPDRLALEEYVRTWRYDVAGRFGIGRLGELPSMAS